ncbi:hypothetical protein Tco_0919203 [Tanacetum coccineum]
MNLGNKREMVDTTAQVPKAITIAPGMYKLDLEQISPQFINNKGAHNDYIKHDMCVLDYIHNVNVRAQSKSAKLNKKKKIWKPFGKVFNEIGYKWRPTGRNFTIVGTKCPLTRITSTKVLPLKETIKQSVVTPEPKLKVVQIVLWYLDSGCNKHMTGNHSQLINFVSKFVGTVRFGNNHIAKIMGYGDYQMRSVTISWVYYVEGLRHNLFFVGQFCDLDLKVAFRKHTCYIHELEGVDLLKGSRVVTIFV